MMSKLTRITVVTVLSLLLITVLPSTVISTHSSKDVRTLIEVFDTHAKEIGPILDEYQSTGDASIEQKAEVVLASLMVEFIALPLPTACYQLYYSLTASAIMLLRTGLTGTRTGMDGETINAAIDGASILNQLSQRVARQTLESCDDESL